MRPRLTIVRALSAALGGCLAVLGPVAGPGRASTVDPQHRLWIGAYANTPQVPVSTVATFDAANGTLGPLRFRRCFDSSLPASFQQSCARDDWSHGYRSFVSWKPPGLDHAGTAAGKYDAQIRAWAISVPTTIGLYATVWHEPENDGMTGAEYVAMYQHVYTVVKAANPSITFGPVYMAYWWQEGTDHYAAGGPNAWWVWDRYSDFAAVDTYAPNPTLLKDNAGFQGWLRFMNTKAPDKPLVMAEYGQCVQSSVNLCTAAEQAARARIIPVDEAYLRSMRFTMWLLWQGTGPQGDWRLTDAGSQAAWRSVAANGRTS